MSKFNIFTATKRVRNNKEFVWVTGYFKSRQAASGWYHIEAYDATDMAKSMGIIDVDELLRVMNQHWEQMK